MGRLLHRNIDKEGVVQEGDTWIHGHQWVWSDLLLVSGIIDAVEERNENLVPIKYKQGQMGRHLSDHFQLCAVGLCLEERTGAAIAHREIFYYANRRQRVPFTSELRHATETAIAAAHQASRQPMPAPIDRPEKCQAYILQPISRDTLMAKT